MTTLPIAPVYLCLSAGVISNDFPTLVRHLLDAMANAGLPNFSTWVDSDSEGSNLASLEAALEQQESPSKHYVFVQFSYDNYGLIASARHAIVDGDSFCSFNIDFTIQDIVDHEPLLAFQENAVSVCKYLLSREKLYSASLTTERGSATAIPDVPLVNGNSHLCITNADEVNATYTEPQAFWNAGWTEIAVHGGQHLLARDLDVVYGPKYLERILGHQWAMARAAKAEHTGYSKPVLHPSEMTIYQNGDAKLTDVAYVKEEQLVEFSCALKHEAEHINGWEIFTLLKIVDSGALSDGSPVNTVRIVFEEQKAAEQEKWPLLDIGCRVYYYSEGGELQELTE